MLASGNPFHTNLFRCLVFFGLHFFGEHLPLGLLFAFQLRRIKLNFSKLEPGAGGMGSTIEVCHDGEIGNMLIDISRCEQETLTRHFDAYSVKDRSHSNITPNELSLEASNDENPYQKLHSSNFRVDD